MQKLYEIFHIFHFQKQIVSAETIRGNTISSDRIYSGHNLSKHTLYLLARSFHAKLSLSLLFFWLRALAALYLSLVIISFRHFMFCRKIMSIPIIYCKVQTEQLTGSHQAVVRQRSGSCQAVVSAVGKQSAGCRQAVRRQSVGSRQAVGDNMSILL